RVLRRGARAPGAGWHRACNVGALRPDDPVLQSIGATMRSVFGHARALLLPNLRNALLVARNGEPPRPPPADAADRSAPGVSPADREHWQSIVGIAANPRAWTDIGGEGRLLVDDQPILDHLLADSYIARDDHGLIVECKGGVDVAGA